MPLMLYPLENSTGTHWIGGWVAPEPVWMTWRRENSGPYQDSNSDPSVIQPITSLYTNYAILAPILIQYYTDMCGSVLKSC
jgi:hypothetical protein